MLIKKLSFSQMKHLCLACVLWHKVSSVNSPHTHFRTKYPFVLNVTAGVLCSSVSFLPTGFLLLSADKTGSGSGGTTRVYSATSGSISKVEVKAKRALVETLESVMRV